MNCYNSTSHYINMLLWTEGIGGKYHVALGILKTAVSRLTNNKSGFSVSVPVFIKNGGIWFYCPPNDCAIGATVEFPNEITLAIANELSKTDRHVYIDLGANIGDTAFPASKQFPEKRIIAVEPIPFLADAMKRTKDRNGIKNIEVVSAAVSSKKNLDMSVPKFGTAYMSGLASGGANLKANDIPKGSLSYDRIHVDTVSLDSLIKGRSINPKDIALIKIDVEGAEIEALRSGEKTLLDGHPPILFEANSPEALSETKTLLERFGYNNYERISENDHIARL